LEEYKTYDDPRQYGAQFSLTTDAGTAHISIIGPDGDAVALTTTINLAYVAFLALLSFFVLRYRVPTCVHFLRMEKCKCKIARCGKLCTSMLLYFPDFPASTLYYGKCKLLDSQNQN